MLASRKKAIRLAISWQAPSGVEVLMVKEARRYVRTKYDYLFVLTLPFTKLSSRHPLSNSTAVTNARVGSTPQLQITLEPASLVFKCCEVNQHWRWEEVTISSSSKPLYF